MPITTEQLLDKIADGLIEWQGIDTSNVENSQKFIRDGQLQIGQSEDVNTSGVLALFQKDTEANIEDNLQSIVEQMDDSVGFTIQVLGQGNNVTITILGGGFPDGGFDITEYVVGDGNPLNLSQFIPLSQQQSVVDIERANEYLDTNIFELLPTGDTRQARIVRFFQELNALLPPNTPEFDLLDGDGSENPDNFVDRDSSGNWIGAEQYSQNNSISYAQDNPEQSNIDEEDAFIHRLTSTVNDTNQSLTIESIYNTILPYLTDILEDPADFEELPEYQNQSNGYLKFRNPNQGIIVRNTSNGFVEGLDPNNPTYLNTDGTGGFTITMWVRFLDKVSEGTLFNFGNPTRVDNPFGFKLETYVLDKDDPTPHSSHTTWGDFDDYCQERIDNPGTSDIYLPRYFNSNTARYVRLVVNDNQVLRDSHTGVGGGQKRPDIPLLPGSVTRDIALTQTTFIPEDFQEWYFICASFNPAVDEDGSYTPPLTDPPGIDLSNSTNYWLNHIDPTTGEVVVDSGFGNRCKVEIISKTDLLRARGFKS
tara:strand:+ start:140 stop:1747 length:1608 start_codon:yes stop_codon:yes gene_type:complete